MTQYLTLPQARAALNARGIPISDRGILGWIARGYLGGVKVGGRWFIHPATLDKLLSGLQSAA
jgi:hypothetical protein